MRWLVIIAAILFAGCTTISHVPPPADWPKLEQRVHYVPGGKLHEVCSKYAPFWMFIFACSEYDFRVNTCDIWLPEGPDQPWLKEHEEKHCLGYDHPGDPTLQKAWETYKVEEMKRHFREHANP